jgi:hypothetical protein
VGGRRSGGEGGAVIVVVVVVGCRSDKEDRRRCMFKRHFAWLQCALLLRFRIVRLSVSGVELTLLQRLSLGHTRLTTFYC